MKQILTARALNLEALSSAALKQDPCPWASYEGVFEPHVLAAKFPADHFDSHSQRRLLEALGKKGSEAWYQHNVETRALLELGADAPFEPNGLDAPWLEVASDLLSPEYRDCISEVAQYDVRRLRMQAHFWRFGEGSFFQPHVDKPHKMVTHLMYLSDQWTPDMGGCLQLLGSGDPNDVRVEVPPIKNTAVVLRRTDWAWHAVSKVPRGCERMRQVLQVWFWAS
jgi:hypothetical protein